MTTFLVIVNAALVLVVTMLSIYLKSFTSAYSSEKGKNLATKEDVAEITKTVKEIESQISDQVWSRQRRWELKKEVLVSAIDKLAEAHIAMRRLEAVYRVKLNEPKSGIEPTLYTHQSEAMDSWQTASRELTKAVFLIDAICPSDLSKVFYGVDELLGAAVRQILDEKDISSVDLITGKVRDGIKALISAMRGELARDEALILPKK
jgi:hypothetical protein